MPRPVGFGGNGTGTIFLPECAGRKAGDFAKLTGKIVAVIKAGLDGDGGDVFIALQQEAGGVLDSQMDEVGDGWHPHGSFEGSDKTALGHVGDIRQFL